MNESKRLLLTLFASAVVIMGLAAQQTDENVEKGKEVFENTCATCHTTGTKKKIGPGLADLKDGVIPVSGKKVTRENLLELVRNGRLDATPAMPPFEHVLAEEEQEAVVSYLLTFVER